MQVGITPYILVSSGTYFNSNAEFDIDKDISSFWIRQQRARSNATAQESTPISVADWKDIYRNEVYRLVGRMRAGKTEERDWGVAPVNSIYALELADLNFDGTPEFFVYFRPAMDEDGVNVYTIKDGVAKEIVFAGGFPQKFDEQGNINKSSLLQLMENKLTGEQCYIFPLNYGGSGMYEYSDIYAIDKNVSFDNDKPQHGWKVTGAEHLFSTYKDTSVDGKRDQASKYEYKGESVSEDVYKKTYNEFWDSYQPVKYNIPSYQVDYNIWFKKFDIDEKELQSFLDSYVPIGNSVNVKVVLDGNPLAFDQPPIIVDGRTLVPVRTIFEAMGASVDWDGNTLTVTAKRGDDVIIMQVGNAAMTKNGNNIALDVAPQIINGRTLVPVRAVADSFNAQTDWNGDTYTVEIYFSK